MTVYAAPGTEGAIASYRPRYDHYQQTKNLLVSYAQGKQGFF
jgi:hypothetical protein